MRKVLPLLSILFCIACSGASEKPAFTDFLEIREVSDDDPLAHQFMTTEGVGMRLGDPAIYGRSVNRFQMKAISEERYDLLITLIGAEDARWRRFTRSRVGKQAALVVDGKIQCVFSIADPGPAAEDKVLILTIAGVAATQEAADKLEQFIESSKKPLKKEVVSE